MEAQAASLNALPHWLAVAGLGLLAGIAIPVGAALARFERIRPRWLETEFRRALVAFGGGVLLAAVALVLVPEGARELPTWAVALSFGGGGLCFFAIDVLLARMHTSASQLLAMVADFVPEALALGAAFAAGGPTAPLLAAMIALQNLPESFNAYRELMASTHAPAPRLLAMLSALALLGPAAALTGYFWLAAWPTAVAALMLFAAGGILYLVFQDIAPQAKLQRHWAPPLGAVAGFLLGLLGQRLLVG